MTITINHMKIIAASFRRFVYDLDNRYVTEHLYAALKLCEKGEREHRAMGARFTRGAAKYRLGVKDTAALFVARAFFDKEQPTTVAQLASYREDFARSYMARSLASAEDIARWACVTDLSTDLSTDWDYSKDVANG